MIEISIKIRIYIGDTFIKAVMKLTIGVERSDIEWIIIILTSVCVGDRIEHTLNTTYNIYHWSVWGGGEVGKWGSGEVWICGGGEVGKWGGGGDNTRLLRWMQFGRIKGNIVTQILTAG